MVKLSIITTVLNSAATIRDCIESVHSQNQPVEHIIIDGGSTDGTLEIVEEYRSRLSKVVSERDEGIYDGMNKGLRLATGDIIGLLNADDVYAGPDILTKVAKVFNEEHVDSCYGDLVYVHPHNMEKVIRYWHSGSYDVRQFYWGWMPPHPTFFVRRSVYERYGLFNLDLGSAADYELMLRFLVKHRITTAYIPEILVKMRSGGMSNASLKNRLLANRNDRLAWEVNGLKPYPWTLYLKPLRKVGQYIFN
ncbi:MAG: glycosyltransferase, partial [Deltaproteobacteria bacterium]|nr:glycosyltransferase [Deltaproteobacteria bacterium]